MIRFAMDLEMEQPCNTIIQIGAVKFDTETGDIYDDFCRFIKLDKPLSDNIKKLTGITDEQLNNGMTIDEAYDDFVTWINKDIHGFRQAVTWGQGDMSTLRDQISDKSKWVFGRTVCNLKVLHQFSMEANNMKMRSGLKKSMKRWGLNFDGSAHDAVEDAKNTAILYLEIRKRIKGIIK